MAQSVAEKRNYTFVGGLHTESGPLIFPPNTWQEGFNVDPDASGLLAKRNGIDLENGYTYHTDTVDLTMKQQGAYSVHEWNSVAGHGSRNFVVSQTGNIVRFYHNFDSPSVSANELPFTINLDSYKAPYADPAGYAPIQVASANGKLIIVNSNIQPILVTYNADTDTITVAAINVFMRDFKGVDDGLAVDTTPNALSPEHNYNLLNQGWDSTKITTYAATGVYPSNAQTWYHGKDSNDDFLASLLNKQYFGTSQAPKGRYVLNAFDRDRGAVSGLTLAASAREIETFRPSTVAFFAGRAWFSGMKSHMSGGWVMFSQVAQFDNQYGKCYQDADPTSEVISDLIDSDGGVIPIQDCGNIHKIIPYGTGMVVLAEQGVWFISGGGDTGFSATSFRVEKIGSFGCFSPKSVVEVEDSIAYWSPHGIYGIGGDSKPAVKSMTETTIQTLYSGIPIKSKMYAAGVYHPELKVVYWAYYASNLPSDGTDRFKKNRILCFDVRLKAWYLHTIEDLGGTYPPFISDLFVTKGRKAVGEDTVLVNNDGGEILNMEWRTAAPLTGVLTAPATVLYENNELWHFGERYDGSGLEHGIYRYNYETGAYIGMYDTVPFIGPKWGIKWDASTNLLWCVGYDQVNLLNKLVAFNGSTGAVVYNWSLSPPSGLSWSSANMSGCYPLIRESDDSLWIIERPNSPSSSWIHRMNKTSGAFTNSTSMDDPISALRLSEYDGHFYFTQVNSTVAADDTKIHKFHTGTLTKSTVYTYGGGANLTTLEVDHRNNYAYTATNSLNNLEINLNTGTHTGKTITFTFINDLYTLILDESRDVLWISRYNSPWTSGIIEARRISDGSLYLNYMAADIESTEGKISSVSVDPDGCLLIFRTRDDYLQEEFIKMCNPATPIITESQDDLTLRRLKFLAGVNSSSSLYKFTFNDWYNSRNRNAPSKFRDWYTVNTAGVSYSTYIITGYDVGDGVGAPYQMQYLYVTAFMARTETGTESNGDAINQSSVKLQARWNWTDLATPENKWSTEQEVYRHRADRVYNPADPSAVWQDGLPVVVSKSKVRGRGRAVHLKWTAHADKDFQLWGWHAHYVGNKNV